MHLSALCDRVSQLRKWLDQYALPMWWIKGASHPEGGFYERITQDAVPMSGDDRRARVQPRQVYCYAMAGISGWNGEWEKAIDHGSSWFDKIYKLETGLYGSLSDAKDRLIDDSFDLYNQAFAIFSMAAIAEAQPERMRIQQQRALDILQVLTESYKHPDAGFEEARPPREPLCSNPHMHLFEAALAWEGITGSAKEWTKLADEIGFLALHRLIDADIGVLREFFAHDWTPMPSHQGRIVEPGHQFEWAWLLAQWGFRRENERALVSARRLFKIGEAHGICQDRHVVMMTLHDDFTVHNDTARFWPQIEWLKASVRLALYADQGERVAYMNSALKALDAIDLFLDHPIDGLWYDKWPRGQAITDEPTPASTFYHIVSGILECEKVLPLLTTSVFQDI
ncbi:AGE family epimerase/isomerase [Shinella sp. WSJ-2]|uniref:AGE family epimerase/isomerase n=1 Tax=Shinella sp. WSJ-2 TaxID=2303749 RepID=UPI000E3B7647|nr:AGE family epimerase/isomerase [Shinella sp. WSJ-2]RFZ88819.1 AGE family epimerase/isomerase [Shinella sp. WSJ-2]